MKKIFYEKVGRRYVPIAEYDNEFLDSFPKGNHLVMSYPGGSSRRFNIDPAHAPMIAAARVAEDAICRAIAKAAELRPPSTPITAKQKKAWNAVDKSRTLTVLTDHVRNQRCASVEHQCDADALNSCARINEPSGGGICCKKQVGCRTHCGNKC